MPRQSTKSIKLGRDKPDTPAAVKVIAGVAKTSVVGSVLAAFLGGICLFVTGVVRDVASPSASRWAGLIFPVAKVVAIGGGTVMGLVGVVAATVEIAADLKARIAAAQFGGKPFGTLGEFWTGFIFAVVPLAAIAIGTAFVAHATGFAAPFTAAGAILFRLIAALFNDPGNRLTPAFNYGYVIACLTLGAFLTIIILFIPG